MAPKPPFPAPQPPPDLPSMPDVSPVMTNYLRTFALWCRNMFQDRLPAHQALPGIMLQAADAPAGTNPPVFMLQVLSNGSFRTTQIPLGGGQP